MPDKWHGVRDRETRYRRRYVDLLANPEVRDVFVARAKTLAALRRYLDSEGFLEVETPILQPIYGGAWRVPLSRTITSFTRTSTCASASSCTSSA